MKKIFLISLFCAGALGVKAQSTLRVESGHLKVTGGVTLVLDNTHLHNNGTLQQGAGDGFVKFTGPVNVNLLGSGTTTFDQLLMAKDAVSSLSLQSNISVVSKVNFSGGLINLGNSVLDLGNAGIFTSESEMSRATTNGTGYIQATGTVNSPPSGNVGNLGLGNLGAVITSPVNMGLVTIRRGHQVQTDFLGAENIFSVQRFYDIRPTKNNNLKATLQFHYFNAELNNVPESMLYLWRTKTFIGGSYIDFEFSGADTRNELVGYIERNNISKFDVWTAAIGVAPTISCPPDTEVSANLKGCKASVPLTATASGVPAPTITYIVEGAVVSSPYVFSRGTTTVAAIASNGIAPDDTCFFTVTVVCGPVTGSQPVTQRAIDTREVQPTPLVVTARPNPSVSHFTLNWSSGEAGPISLRVVDVLGRVVEQRTNMAAQGVLHLGHRYRPGVYFVQAIQGHKMVMLRVVKGAE